MGFQNQAEVEAFTQWAQQQIEGMGRHVESSGLIKQDATGQAVWTLPHQIFIGKIWPKEDRNNVYWIISGPQLPTDHIEGRLADNAREAARHFSLKWQLEGNRLTGLSDHADGETEATSKDVDWQSIAAKLHNQAEGLYAVVDRDDLWENMSTIEDVMPKGAESSADDSNPA